MVLQEIKGFFRTAECAGGNGEGVKKHITPENLCRRENAEAQRSGNSPVFSLISQSTLKRAGFILWQFRACFLQEKNRNKRG